MRDFFKSKRFKVLLGFMAFLIGVMIFAVTKGGYSLSGASFINTVTQPFRTLSNSIAVKIETNLDKLSNATEYYNENQRLRAQLSELNDKLTEFESMKEELEETRKFIKIREKNPDLTLSEPCEVIGYTTNDPFRSFIINKGKDNGIEPYSPVVTGEGLVGIVVEVSAESSVVRTLLSPDLRIAAVTKTGELAGIIEGHIEQSLKNETRLNHITEDIKLKPGDMLVTSNESGFFPNGYVIGTINQISRDKNGIATYATVEPAAKIERLTSVIVITDFIGKDLSYED